MKLSEYREMKKAIQFMLMKEKTMRIIAVLDHKLLVSFRIDSFSEIEEDAAKMTCTAFENGKMRIITYYKETKQLILSL